MRTGRPGVRALASKGCGVPHTRRCLGDAKQRPSLKSIIATLSKHAWRPPGEGDGDEYLLE